VVSGYRKSELAFVINRDLRGFIVLSKDRQHVDGLRIKRCWYGRRTTCIVLEASTAEIASYVMRAFCTCNLISVNHTWLYRSCEGIPGVRPIRPGRYHFCDLRLTSCVCIDDSLLTLVNLNIDRALDFCIAIFDLNPNRY
jgi:hypothetical protein